MAKRIESQEETVNEVPQQPQGERKQESAKESAKKSENTLETANSELKTFIYIGPTVNDGSLRTNAMMAAESMQEVENFLKDVIEKIPQVKKLIVSVDSLAVNKIKVGTKGTLLYKYYNEIQSIAYSDKGAE